VQRVGGRPLTLRPVRLVTVLLLAAGCGSGPGAPPPADAPSPTQEEPQGDAEPHAQEDGPGGASVISETDDGSSVALHQGDEVALRLASDWLWDEPQLSGDAIEITRVDHLVDPGYAEWRLAAATPGEVELTASGEPNCGDAGRCPERTVRIVIEVAGPPEATDLDVSGRV
jgi:predicted secreted protein